MSAAPPPRSVQLKRGRICPGVSKSESVPLTLMLSRTAAPVVEFHPVGFGVVAGARSSKKRFVLTRNTTRTVLHEAPAGIAGAIDPLTTPVLEKIICGASGLARPKSMV